MSLFCFDLDGTIFNSIEGIRHSLNYALKKNNLNTVSNQILRNHIGPPLFTYLDEVTREDLSNKTKELIMKDFRIQHDSKGYKFYTLYHDVESVLKKIREKNKMYIVTNKPYRVTENALKYFNLFNLFDDIFTMDKSTNNFQIWPEELKRNKSNYLLNLDILNKNIDKYYIGDTESDYQSTMGNSFEFIYAKYGFGIKFNTERIQYKIENFKDLLDLDLCL